MLPSHQVILFGGQHYALDGLPKSAATYSLRRLLSSYTANKAINVRRASDNATTNIGFVGQDLDTAAAAAFAGTDATASCSTVGSSTTLVCTGASSTPHVGDTITGAGIVQPAYIVSVGAFVAGAGSCTMNAAQNIAVAETVTFQVALFVPKWYDQSGNGNDAVQATAENQPQLLLNGINNLPDLQFGGNTYSLSVPSGIGGGAASIFASAVLRYPSTASNFIAIRSGASASFQIDVNAPTPRAIVSTVGTGAAAGGGTISVNVAAVQSLVYDGAHVSVFIDGVQGATAVATGATVASSALYLSYNGTGPRASEMLIWVPIIASSARTTVMANQKAYWGTP